MGVVEGGELPVPARSPGARKENQENWLTRDPEIKCYLPGVPRATYMPYPFQIMQSASAIFIAYEYAGAVRNIYLKDPGPPPVDSWMGQSVGRWEGETLVVDVTGFNDQTWFDRSGNFHSDALHVVERYTRTSPDVMLYEATIEDPKVFTRPWKMSMPLYRRQEKNAQIMDFKCVEFVEELMYGQWRKNAARPPDSGSDSVQVRQVDAHRRTSIDRRSRARDADRARRAAPGCRSGGQARKPYSPPRLRRRTSGPAGHVRSGDPDAPGAACRSERGAHREEAAKLEEHVARANRARACRRRVKGGAAQRR